MQTLETLWKYFRDKPALVDGRTIYFSDDNNNSASFKFKQPITGQTGNSDTKDVEIIVPLKYLSNFRRTPEMPLINCEIILQLKWSKSPCSWYCSKSKSKFSNN